MSSTTSMVEFPELGIININDSELGKGKIDVSSSTESTSSLSITWWKDEFTGEFHWKENRLRMKNHRNVRFSTDSTRFRFSIKKNQFPVESDMDAFQPYHLISIYLSRKQFLHQDQERDLAKMINSLLECPPRKMDIRHFKVKSHRYRRGVGKVKYDSLRNHHLEANQHSSSKYPRTYLGFAQAQNFAVEGLCKSCGEIEIKCCMLALDRKTGLRSPFAFSLSWVVFAVRVQTLQSNPSLLFVLSSSQPLKGVRVFVYVELERFIGVLGRWEWVGVSCDGTWDSGKARKTMGKGGMILAVNGLRIGPSKSSQSLSIAHKWAVEID
ncbi:hypothetical protein Tco_0954034 [Tanacetum coccineum]|uniref:Uncharacterized protein n=1 Tax=Tanacetum coccineum TaxID=301880 RepID=A0ABQ5E2L2_9ASTR